MLTEHLSHYVSTNCPHDTDGLKHLPFPPQWLKETGQKVIFISGDIDTICSRVECRGWLAKQGGKLGSFGAIAEFRGIKDPGFGNSFPKYLPGPRWHGG
jgi:hypothetical protein